MSSVFSGVTVVLTGNTDCKVLASFLSNISFDTLNVASKGNPGVTELEFNSFLARVGRAFLDAGVLDENLNITNNINAPL